MIHLLMFLFVPPSYHLSFSSSSFSSLLLLSSSSLCSPLFYSFLIPLELPSLLPVIQVCEALLRLEKGSYFLCRLIANIPDVFDEGDWLGVW